MPKLIIIRGLPGSGKSTLAKSMNGFFHLEADTYFSLNESYRYNPKRIEDAHNWCLATTKTQLERGLNVVVSNTFTQRWEYQPYIDLGYPYEIIVATGNFKSIHNVPEEVIEKMRARWED